MSEGYEVVLTCEHGGNKVPAQYARLFKGKGKLLDSHRGYDLGALQVARRLFHTFGGSLFYSTVTRLLVDLNRSPENPRRFSEITRRADSSTRENIIRKYYSPYRDGVETAVRNSVKTGVKVLHISVHSFTPVLRGRKRDADIGLLYDPKRKPEAEICVRWRKALLAMDASLRVRRNYPYRGTSDGLTSYLRKLIFEDKYVGIEIEINQKYPLGQKAVWHKFMKQIEVSLASVISIPD